MHALSSCSGTDSQTRIKIYSPLFFVLLSFFWEIIASKIVRAMVVMWVILYYENFIFTFSPLVVQYRMNSKLTDVGIGVSYE